MIIFRYTVLGVLFGVILSKSEVISWYRIQEMFHFDSFHMYGVIGTAVVLGAVGVILLKKFKVKSIRGNDLSLNPKKIEIPRLLLGGTIFGLGWSFTGACPGPLYALLGYGVGIVVVILLSAVLGAFVYGLVKSKLPH